jgi:NTE family protein
MSTNARDESSDIARDEAKREIAFAADWHRGPIQPAKQTKPRRGIALCLSGGGFRAALFHLGALTRLNELGVLPLVTTYSCVSGGSILGAHLAAAFKNNPALNDCCTSQQWHEGVVLPFLEFVNRDIRTLSFLHQACLWRYYVKGKGARRLQQYYEQLTRGMKLEELPTRPRFVFCSTDLVFATCWISERRRIGDWRAGFIESPPDHWTVAKAVAASSCFPPLFLPLPTDIPGDQFPFPPHHPARERAAWKRIRRKIRLTDGGVYDNLGIEPVWKTHKTLLVSDGGAPLQYKVPPPGLRLMRYTEVIQNQVASLRKRWIIDVYERAKRGHPDTFDGTYWGIASATARYRQRNETRPAFGYSKSLAREVIARIRTDLDPFSPNEIHVLMKHGYELAEIALRTHASHLIKNPSALMRTWPAPLYCERAVKKALRGSSRRRYFRFSRRHLDASLLE